MDGRITPIVFEGSELRLGKRGAVEGSTFVPRPWRVLDETFGFQLLVALPHCIAFDVQLPGQLADRWRKYAWLEGAADNQPASAA